MIQVPDTAAARVALVRRKLGCPDCGHPLRLWGHARESTQAREPGGTLATVRLGPEARYAPAAMAPTSCPTPGCCHAAPTPQG